MIISIASYTLLFRTLGGRFIMKSIVIYCYRFLDGFRKVVVCRKGGADVDLPISSLHTA